MLSLKNDLTKLINNYVYFYFPKTMTEYETNNVKHLLYNLTHRVRLWFLIFSGMCCPCLLALLQMHFNLERKYLLGSNLFLLIDMFTKTYVCKLKCLQIICCR